MLTPTRLLSGLALALALAAVASAQAPTPDQQAEMLLAAGRKAYNDGNPTFAAEKFREFVQKFGGHKDVQAARYGLGLALLDLPERDYAKALESLGPPAGDANFADRPLALYYAAASHRGLGLKELEQGVQRPNEMPQRQQAANGRFAEAVKFFTQAREAFEKKADAEWAARSRCDQAEIELRLGKSKEARATAEPFVKDVALAKSPFRPLGLYYHGFACFLLRDVPAAGRSLNQLTPFEQPFGPHARFLMGRVHQMGGENAEAAAAFDGVIAGFIKQKAAAVEALKPPDRFKNDPWEKARLEALARGPVPDYVAGAAFYGACLNYEAGRFGEALAKFQAFAREFASSPLKEDALLRAGFCFVQTKQFDEAVKVLLPIAQQQPRLADQAFYWLGKAQLGLAQNVDPNNASARTQAFATAINSLRSGADRAAQLAGADPDAKARRADILLELADAQLTAKQAREAAGTYETIRNEKLLPTRDDEVLQRLVAAYHLAGDFAASESRVAEFVQKFPQSPLLPLVLFRSAENSYAKAAELVKGKNPAAKPALAEAAKKYEAVVARFPEFDRASRAKYGLALCHVAAEDWEKAAEALESIPGPDRTGDLSAAAYILADCKIRTAPAKAEDALQDNVLREKLGEAAVLLEGFVAASPKAPEAPDALVKLGYCYKRLGAQLPPGNERNDALNKARGTFERMGREFPQSPLVGTANLERAKVMALQGDKGGATNALRAFTNDPLRQSPVAPLALIYLATLLREQNQAAQAAQVLADARQRYEGQLTGERAEWVHLLRYHHGVALFESGKPADARTAFDAVVGGARDKPIGAEAALKACQCQTEEVKKKNEAIEKERAKGGLNPEQITQIDGRLKAAKAELIGVGKLFERRAEEFKAALPQADARARMLYDAAWVYRTAGEDAVPAYTKLVAEFPSLSLGVEARLELAELLADKGKPDDAIKLLKDALDAEPTDKPTPPETTERIRLRLGAALFAKKDFAAAQGQFDAVAGNDKSPHRGQALYRSAECLIAQNKWDDARNKLVIFRDNGAFHNVPGVSDRAVLRLGHVLLEQKQWEPARQAFELVTARYGGNNAWAADARYGAGWALQNMGRFDEAVNTYVQVTQATTDERAGRAHLQIGLCRAAQKRWDDAGKALATVYYTYDIPELKFAAMVEHARVYVELKKPDEAVKLLERVLKEAPAGSEWTKAARERLDKIKK
jgi:tetratricopeptide (TPR) repeat protein